MNITKKVIAVFLVALCMFSLFAFSSSAVDEIMSELLGTDVTVEPDIDERFSYGVHYEVDSMSGISVMYKPNPDIEMNTPCKVEVSDNFPIAIDYVCYAWRDENGKIYYPGDYIICMGKVTLYAVWEEKTDNDPKPVRAIKTGFQVFIKMLQQAFEIFKAVNSPATPIEPTTTTTKPPLIVPTEGPNK